MFRSSWAPFFDHLGKHFYPVSILSVICILSIVVLYLPTQFAIFGLYGLFGLLGGAVVYYRTTELVETCRHRAEERYYRTGVYVVSAVTVGVVALTGEPMFVVVGLLAGYLLFVYQFVGQPTPERMLPQLTVLFLLSPIVKYLTAGKYIGHGDILYHVGLVDALLVGESLSAIATASYYDVPGLHLTAATVSSLSGIEAYDGVMVIGLVAFSLVIPAVYLIALRITSDPTLALSTAFGIAVLNDISFYVSYAFPQSISTVLIVVLILLGSMVSRDAIRWRITGIFTLLTIALAFTHHLTQLVFLPLAACFLGSYLVLSRSSVVNVVRSRQFGLFFLALLLNGLILWIIGFYERLYEPFALLFDGGLFGGYSQSVTVGLGMTPPSSSVSLALDWLVSPYALYLILLLVVFSLGVVSFLRTTGTRAVYSAVVVSGLVGSALIFETPISIKSLSRIGFPWQFAFAFVVGIGIQQLRQRIGLSGMGRLLMVVLVLLAAVGPLVAADNYYGLDPRPTEQTSFSEQEYIELQATESFISGQDEPTTVFWDTRLVMNRYGSDGLQHGTIEDQEVFLPEGHFVYRSGFSDHEISFTTRADGELYGNNAHISDGWLTHRIETGNHVYTAGGTGTLWSPDERSLE